MTEASPNYGVEDGERLLKDRATIFAYLEDLQRTGAEVRLVVQGHPPLPATVGGVQDDPDRFLVRLGRPLPVTWIRRKEIALLFTLDGIQFLAPVRFLERLGYLETYLSIPESVRHADRRTRMRAQFHPRDKATVTVLEGLMDARGATGQLLDLSMGGLLMRVDRAITIRGKAPLALTEDTFTPRTRFPILRIDQLPYSPVVVCSGFLARTLVRDGAVLLGIQFEGMGEMETQVLRQVLGRRLPRFSEGFPKRKRERDTTRDLEPRLEAAQPAQEAAAAPDPNRASKRLLVVLHDDLDRAILVASLRADGYRKLHEARGYADAMSHVKLFPMDAVILEEKVGLEPAEDFLGRLWQQGYCEAVPKILLASRLDVRTHTLAHTGRIDHVQALAAGYDGEFREVLAGLLGL